MINKQTQNAWLAYMRSQAGNAKFLIAKDYDSGVVQDIEKPVRDGFDAGYAVATADCEAKVRELDDANERASAWRVLMTLASHLWDCITPSRQQIP